MTLRIGISARLLHAPPPGLGLPLKRLQYLESNMAHWIMNYGVVALMIPFIDQRTPTLRKRPPTADLVENLDGLVLQGGIDISPATYGEKPWQDKAEYDPIRDEYELELLRGLKTGTVRIATVESVGIAFLPEIISEFGRRYPGLQLEVSMVSAAEVVERLVSERAEVGFGFITDRNPQVSIALQRDVKIGAVLRHDHPLAGNRGPIGLSECLQHPLAMATPEISIRKVVEPFLMQATKTLPPLVEVDSIRMLVELALTGRYVSITTPIGAQTDIAEGRLVFRPLVEEGLPENRFGLMVRAGSNLPLAAAVFLEHARNQFQRIDLPGASNPDDAEPHDRATTRHG
jgi:DNA-binding transcriptional LysR family regulator